MNRLLLCLSLVLLTLALRAQDIHLPVSKASDNASALYQKAQQAFDKQQHRIYTELLQQAAAADTSFFAPRARLALHGWLTNDQAALKKWGAEALSITTKRNTAEDILAAMLKLAAAGPEADLSPAGRRLAEAYPKLVEAHFLNGQVQLRASQTTEALKAFFKMRELNPSYGLTYKMLGKTYMKAESWSEAGAYFEMYINISPGLADPHHCIGDFYKALAWNEHSARHYQWALNIDPELDGVKQKLAEVEKLLKE